MFDAQQIANEIIAQVEHHVYWKYMQALYFVPENVYNPYNGTPLPREQSPLLEWITRLCRIANGEIERETADDFWVGETLEMIQSLCETLVTNPGAFGYHIPQAFWQAPLGQVVMLADVWCRNGELLTISAAAEIAYGENNQANRMKIARAIERGTVRGFVDPKEPNPQHNRRVLRSEVEGLTDD